MLSHIFCCWSIQSVLPIAPSTIPHKHFALMGTIIYTGLLQSSRCCGTLHGTIDPPEYWDTLGLALARRQKKCIDSTRPQEHDHSAQTLFLASYAGMLCCSAHRQNLWGSEVTLNPYERGLTHYNHWVVIIIIIYFCLNKTNTTTRCNLSKFAPFIRC